MSGTSSFLFPETNTASAPSPASASDLPPGYTLKDVQGNPFGDYALKDALKSSLHSIGPSIYNQFKNALKAVTVDAPETVENLGKMALDSPIFQPSLQAMGMLAEHMAPEQKTRIHDFMKSIHEPTDALKQSLIDHYGSWGNFKRTLAEDPGAILSDAMMFTPGAPEAAAGKIGALVAKVPGVAATARFAKSIPESAATEVLGHTTRVGGETIGEMARAGRAGDKGALDNLNRRVNYDDVVDDLQSTLTQIYRKASQDYARDIAPTKANHLPINMANIDSVLQKADDIGTRSYTLPTQGGGTTLYKRNIETNPKALSVRQQIADAVENWKNPSDLPPGVDPADYAKIVHTPWGLDELKQNIGNLRRSLSPTAEGFKPAYAYATSVYNGLKDEIKRLDPNYAASMKNYETAMKFGDEAQRALLGSKTAAADTSLRKLQSVFRNDVNTSYSNRLSVFRQLLDKAGRPDIGHALAGQAMSSFWPRGMGVVQAPLELLAMSLAHPAFAAAAPLFSPRLVGRGAYYYGRGAEKLGAPVGRGVGMLGSKAGVLPQVGNIDERTEGPPFKGGGFFKRRGS